MDLVLVVEGREYRMEVRGRDEVAVEVDGTTFTFQVIRQGDELLLRSGDVTHRARVQGRRLIIDGRPVDFAVRGVGVEAAAAPGGGGRVTPPMPGRVVSVAVRPGDRVRKGTPLLVVESMKMQNEVPAPVAGIVKLVLVAPGQGVGTGETLVIIEPEEAG